MTKSDPRNAAILFRSSTFKLGSGVTGQRAASNSFLEGFARHSGRKTFYVMSPAMEESRDFSNIVRGIAPATEDVVHVPYAATRRLGTPGLLFRPDPLISQQAWWRRRFGQRLFSVCGVAHTTSTKAVQLGLPELVTGPAQSWDAVICPSQAVKSMITTVIDAQSEYLTERFGGQHRSPLQLPVIPLGIDCERFAPTPERIAQGKALREQLGIGSSDVSALFVGRLSHTQKINPVVSLRVMAKAAELTRSKLHIIWCGWFRNPADEKLFLHAAKDLCPEVGVHVVDGQQAATLHASYHAADVFMALVDNIQETFGLVPVEAMAAGLPVIVSDWNGFKETVRHDVDGYRVPTALPPPGAGDKIAWDYDCHQSDYHAYLLSVSQTVSIDMNAAARALAGLADNPDLRRSMGASGRLRANEVYDWRNIIPAYQDLWEELAGRRLKDTETGAGERIPHALDPLELFSRYPSRTLMDNDTYEWSREPTGAPAEAEDFPGAMNEPRGVPFEGLPQRLGDAIRFLDGRSPDPWLTVARYARWFGVRRNSS